MTIGAVARKTTNFLFNIINFDAPRWHTYERENWDSVDAILSGLAADRGVVGTWSYGLDVSAGDRYIDSSDGSVWFAVVPHTTAASGTFADDRTARPTYWISDTISDLSISTAKLQNGAVTLPKMADVATARLLGRASPGTGSPEALTTTQVKALLGDYPVLHGQCKLSKSGSNLILLPFNGNKLTVNGTSCTIPDAGVTLAPPSDTVTMTIASPAVVSRASHGLVTGTPIKFATTGALPTGVTAGQTYYVISAGLTTNAFQFSATVGGSAVNTSGSQSGTHTLGTLRYIYATQSGAAINALEQTLIAHATSTTTGNKGIEVKTGDDNRTLVGIAFDLGNGWADSSIQRLVRSYFNRGALTLTRAFTAQRTSTALSSAEINTEVRCEFVCFPDDSVWASASAYVANSGANYSYLGIMFDGGAPTTFGSSFGTNGSEAPTAAVTSLTEGYHYTTLGGSVGAGTATYGTGTGVYGSLKIEVYI